MNRAFAAGLVLLLVVGRVHADVGTEARFFDDLARKAFERGRYREALEAFLLLQEIAPSPRALYNVALCAELAGDRPIAFIHYQQYLVRGDADEARRRDAEKRSATLRKQLALVEVRSQPAGAIVYVDREELGSHGTAPAAVPLEPGKHVLILKLDGHHGARLELDAKVGETKPLEAVLSPRLGTVVVDVGHAESELVLVRDGLPTVPVVPGQPVQVAVGSYSLRASAPGHAAKEARLVVREGETTRHALVLEPLPKPTGRLMVSATSTGTEVFVDGKRVAVTPATLPALSVGSHELELRGKNGRRWRGVVIIEEGKTRLVEVDLGKPNDSQD